MQVGNGFAAVLNITALSLIRVGMLGRSPSLGSNPTRNPTSNSNPNSELLSYYAFMALLMMMSLAAIVVYFQLRHLHFVDGAVRYHHHHHLRTLASASQSRLLFDRIKRIRKVSWDSSRFNIDRKVSGRAWPHPSSGPPLLGDRRGLDAGALGLRPARHVTCLLPGHPMLHPSLGHLSNPPRDPGESAKREAWPWGQPRSVP